LVGLSGGTGGTNIGVYGQASGGTTNWAGYFEGDTKISTNIFVGAVNSGFPGYVGNNTNGTRIGDGYMMMSRANTNLYLNNMTGGPDAILSFSRNAIEVGNVTTSPTGTSYNTVSDYRLKTVDGPVTTSGAFIDALQPKVGEWKAEPGKKAAFFIAHEVQAVSPSSVSGEKDAVDKDGKAVMQSMEYGSAEFIANIIAELQDLRKRVKKLEAKA
jgi:hypothetical protein